MRAPRKAYLKQLNGRSLNATERAYYWRTEEQLLELYKENYDNLRVLGSLIKHSEIDAIVEERLTERIAGRDQEIEKLKKQLGKVDSLERAQNKLLAALGFDSETWKSTQEYEGLEDVVIAKTKDVGEFYDFKPIRTAINMMIAKAKAEGKDTVTMPITIVLNPKKQENSSEES